MFVTGVACGCVGEVVEVTGSRWREISVEEDLVGAETMRTQMLRNAGRLQLRHRIRFSGRSVWKQRKIMLLAVPLLWILPSFRLDCISFK